MGTGLRVLNKIANRLVQAVPVLLGIATLGFLITQILPGDPVRMIMGPIAPEEDVEKLRVELGLKKPLVEQYLNYLSRLSRGDLGKSITGQAPIGEEIARRLGSTLELITLGVVVATAYGITVGALATYSRRARRPLRALMALGLSFPDFVLALVLIYFVFFKLSLAPPPVGQLGLGATPPPRLTGAVAVDALVAGQWKMLASALHHLLLPVLTLAFIYGSPIAKIAESAFQDSRRRPFYEYARLTGLGSFRIFGYLLRSALPPIATLSGVIYGYLLGGAVLVELVFSWGGFAQYGAQAILARDIPVIQAFLLTTGTFSLLIYLVLDILYEVLDPRVRT